MENAEFLQGSVYEAQDPISKRYYYAHVLRFSTCDYAWAAYVVIYGETYGFVSRRWCRVDYCKPYELLRAGNLVFRSTDKVPESSACIPPQDVLDFYAMAPLAHLSTSCA